MIINKRYDLNFIETLVNLYDYKADFHMHGIILIACDSNNFYQTRIICEVNDDLYENGGNFYINRFSIEFSGFGCCDKEKEDLIYNNLVKAKQLVYILNTYIDKCNKEYEKGYENVRILPSTHNETLFQKEDYPTND